MLIILMQIHDGLVGVKAALLGFKTTFYTQQTFFGSFCGSFYRMVVSRVTISDMISRFGSTL